MTPGILAPQAKSTTNYANNRSVDFVGTQLISSLNTPMRQALTEGNHSESNSSNKSPLPNQKVIGIYFKSSLDAEAYASRLAMDARFKTVVVSDGPSSNHQVSSPIDLLLTDRCLRKEHSAQGANFYGHQISTASKLVRLRRELASPCNCCRTLASSSTWSELLTLLGNLLGLLPATLDQETSVLSSHENASHLPRKQTPAARRGLPAELDALTRREIDILQLVGRGMSVREMASELNLAESTIGNHKYRLMRKLDVTSSLGLLRISVRCGLSEL